MSKNPKSDTEISSEDKKLIGMALFLFIALVLIFYSSCNAMVIQNPEINKAYCIFRTVFYFGAALLSMTIAIIFVIFYKKEN